MTNKSNHLCIFLITFFYMVTAQAGELAGRVSSSAGDFSLAGAEVTVSGTNFRIITDQNGLFRILGIPAGEYTVIINYVGADTVRRTISVSESGITRLNSSLRPAGGVDEEILVVGQRASQASALSRQRSSESISSFLTRDSIGQFPDQNVSESVRRLHGVSVQNDQGEGRYIVLRGLDPNLNSASINGTRLP